MSTILHAADIHLDSPLRGLRTSPEAPVDELRGATRAAFDQLVNLAVEQAVDAVVLAGDLYDGDRDDFDTAIYLQRRLAQLTDEGIAVVVAYGNHDAASEITRRLRPPPGVRVLPHDRPGSVLLEDAGLALHGQSYATRSVTENLSAAYPAPLPGLANIGVLHTCLDGRPGHEPYAPCRPEALATHGYQYWALGHVHRRDNLCIEGTHLVFPGNLQGRHANETGAKGATIVRFAGDHLEGLEHKELDAVRWVRVNVDGTGVGGEDELSSKIRDAVHAETEGISKLCAVRVEVAAASPAAGECLARYEQWIAQLRADLAGSTGRLWLEKVVMRPARPGAGPPGHDAVEAVQQLVASLTEDDEALVSIAEVLTPLRDRLGADVVARLAATEATDLTAQGMGQLLAEAEALLLAEMGRE